jgi:predicted nucleic acid-binding protein
VASLADTNILVYCFDHRYPAKLEVAREWMERGMVDGSVKIAHQSILEFVAVVIRPRRERDPLFTLPEARRKAEEFLADYEILYPNESTVRTALQGAEKHHLSWYDAHLWAYAETNGLAEILSEDFSHNQLYGNVRIVNPFA